MPELDNKRTTYLDGVLADAQGVPQLHRLVARTGHDLPVVSGEGDTQHILGVADEATGGEATGRGERKKHAYQPHTSGVHSVCTSMGPSYTKSTPAM